MLPKPAHPGFLDYRQHTRPRELRPEPPGFAETIQKRQITFSGEADYKYVPRLRQVCFYNPVPPRSVRCRKKELRIVGTGSRTRLRERLILCRRQPRTRFTDK